MKRFFAWLGMTGQTLVAWVMPFAQKARGPTGQGISRGLRWTLHFILLIAILVGLWYLNNNVFDIAKDVKKGRFFRQFWLPILFLLLYLLGWLIYWLWGLLGAEDEGPVFPDIDKAWGEAMNALALAGLRVADLPLFLVLGQPEGDERNLFQAAQLKFVVDQTPAGAEEPLHVYAGKDAIYVTCPGASLLGLQAAVLSGRVALAPQSAGTTSGGDDDEEDDPLVRTLRPEDAEKVARNIGTIANVAYRQGRPLNEFERRQIRGEYRRANPRNSLLKHPDRIDLLTRRLAYLCRLIARDRYPFCPINGVLLLVPFAGTDSDQDATDTGEVFRRDLATARAVLKVHCPVIVLVCDFETLPGFAEFVGRFGARERLQRVGQRCPLVPDLSRSVTAADGNINPVANMLDSLAGWICHAVVPAWVYRSFQLERAPGPEGVATAVRHNAQLYLFANELRERRQRLGVILTQALAMEPADPPLVGGCYVAGTGKSAASEQAFVAAVLRRLVDEQNCVSWNDQTLREEDRLRRWTNVGWGVLGLTVLTAAALLAFRFLGD